MYTTLLTFLTLSVCTHGLVRRPDQVTVPFGKRLKLSVENAGDYSSLRWRFNNGPPSEKCDVTKTDTTDTLICLNMEFSDAGLYEYQAIRRDGQMETLLAVNADVAECAEEMAEKQLADSSDCYCSGITDQCHMAQDLFRTQIMVNVSEEDLVNLKMNTAEFWDNDFEREASTYYSLPREFTGNLLNSYGGYLEFPALDDETDHPYAMLKGKNYALVHYTLRELESEELSRSTIKMTEQNWRLLNNKPASRFIFMNVLASVEAFYVKFNHRTEPQKIVLDSGETIDHGLGKVDTVEQCNCREGYEGMSCETCARGYYRRHAVGMNGICVSIKEKLKAFKQSEEKRLQIKTYLQSMKN